MWRLINCLKLHWFGFDIVNGICAWTQFGFRHYTAMICIRNVCKVSSAGMRTFVYRCTRFRPPSSRGRLFIFVSIGPLRIRLICGPVMTSGPAGRAAPPWTLSLFLPPWFWQYTNFWRDMSHISLSRFLGTWWVLHHERTNCTVCGVRGCRVSGFYSSMDISVIAFLCQHGDRKLVTL